MTKNKKYPID